MKCTQRLYLTADRKRVVPQGHKDAATLYASPGDEIPQSAAAMFGLVDGALPEKKGSKSTAAPANKEKQAGSDKQKDAGSAKDDAGAETDATDGPSLTAVKGIGEGMAKVLSAAGIGSVAALAGIDPESPPSLDGWRGIPKWAEWVESAKALLAPAE
ncbi:hypothetical protein [Pelagerythrobacter marinus]|uniref:hypothetical protein n=1 Tax=Pelagerythrobacter marinus TaxID=538382 RepID=UPI002AC94076|nr:hypothetical protein [Pelagerythrobacter marinus]WPZ06583.1 hypothetical protein T8T98_14395 [Pelagerythrobacter marinus]